MGKLQKWRRSKWGKSGPNPPQAPGPDPISHGNRVTDTPTASFLYGVKVLHDCLDATVDIIFIHGLFGDRESTWTAEGQSVPWPKTLLPPKLGKARILTYGYDSYLVRRGVAGSNRLLDHATNLLRDLTTDRSCTGSNASSRPLIFIAHGLGGIVCKKAILLSRNNRELHLRGIFDCTIGIIFMGTPHKGSWMADWAKIPASAVGLVKSANKSLLEILETDDPLLESIQVEFLSMVRALRESGSRFEVTCFFEELPLHWVGKVVSKESATFEGYACLSIHANHRDMVKFASAEENGFKRLLGELVRWTSQAPPAQVLEGPFQDCLRSLAFSQMQSRFHDISSAVEGTCEWLPRHRAYKTWATCDRGLLWIRGKPGSGKSTLLKHSLNNHASKKGDLILSFFFQGCGHELQRSPLGLFRSLLHQILRQAPDALPGLVDIFEERCKFTGKLGGSWDWHEEELSCFLKSSIWKVLETHSVWLFLDALNDCGVDNAVKLVEMFKSLLRGHSSQPTGLKQLRICFSCRHYPILDLDGMFDICLEDKNSEDISTFVDGQLSAFCARTSSTIPALITKLASGVFMWASLVVKQVLNLDRQGVALKKIEAAVHFLPPNLEDLYRQLIRTMDSASLKLIQWLCFATRPLSMNELQWAMVVEADCPHHTLEACRDSNDYVSEDDRMKRQVQTLSRGLAEVTHTQLVQFTHQTVKDFMIEKGLSVLDGGVTSPEAAIRAHSRLAGSCIRYLAMEEIGRSTRIDNVDGVNNGFPFLRYAATSWVVHTKQCESDSILQQNLLALLPSPSNAAPGQEGERMRQSCSTLSKPAT